MTRRPVPPNQQPASAVGPTGCTTQNLPAELLIDSESRLCGQVFCGGLSIPKGMLRDAGTLHVLGLENTEIAQTEVLDRWSDGSVRWMLASFAASSEPRHNGDFPTHSLSGEEQQSRVRKVPVQFCLAANDSDARDSNLTSLLSGREHTSVKVLQNAICVSTQSSDAARPVCRTVRVTPRLRAGDGTMSELVLESVRPEVSGSIRQVFVIGAYLKSQPDVTLQIRITNWPAVGTMQLETRIRNTRRARHQGGLWDLGDSGSFSFTSLHIDVTSDELSGAATAFWSCDRGRQLQAAETDQQVSIHQFSSGGPNQDSLNHMTASGRSSVTKHGYAVQSGSTSQTGARAEPVLSIVSEEASLTVAVPEFWQKFPGSLAAAGGRITVGIFPDFDGNEYELQGGEQSTQLCWIFGGSEPPAEGRLDQVFAPSYLIQSPTWHRKADVFPWFPGAAPRPATHGDFESGKSTPSLDSAERLGKYLLQAMSGRFELSARRDGIDEYGWRNFGDVPADHEQTHFAGPGTVISHYNNQFDMIYGAILQFAASGDRQWRELFDPLARHVTDIDVYHTSQDRAAFNGGLFWHTDHYVDARSATHRTYSRQNQKPGCPYGGGPSCEHNYTTGLLYYHFLTGNVDARESVLSLAEWVLQMDDGRNTIFGLLDSGPTGLASATVFEDFHGPGRGAGNSVNALLDAWLLTRSDRFLNKAEDLIRRCVHPNQNPEELHLSDAEGHWSYTVFLTALSRYLLVKQEAGLDDAMAGYARDVMSRYGRWMAENERPTLSQPEKLQYPTEAWAAQDFRKANVLHLAAACEDDPMQASAMRSKAIELNDAAWTDLYSFGEAHLTARCLSILMTEGQRDLFHRCCDPILIPPATVIYQAPEWTMFVPQRARVRAMLKNPRRLLRASFRLLNPRRWHRAIQALIRQL